MSQVLLLAGASGTGKTTIIRETISVSGVSAGGFYTQEIRQDGIRLGFEIITLDGHRSTMAHTEFHGHQRVGKYGVSPGQPRQSRRASCAPGHP